MNYSLLVATAIRLQDAPFSKPSGRSIEDIVQLKYAWLYLKGAKFCTTVSTELYHLV